MNRGQFLKDLGLSTKALMAFYCLGAVSACGSKKEDPDPGGNGNGGNGNGGNGTGGNTGITGTTSGSNINFTVDLTHQQYSKLKNQGEFVYVANIIIANARGTIVALSKICTHEGATIEFRAGQNDFLCNNHGSQFNLDGTVKLSPAESALQVFKTELSNDGNSLTVKA